MPEKELEQAIDAARCTVEIAESPPSALASEGIDEIVRQTAEREERSRQMGPGERRQQEMRPSLVGECVDANHPTLKGRVLVKWITVDGESRERWLPTLQNLPVRPKDRVLLVNPGNWDELVVTGVIDGFAKRPQCDRQTAGRLELERDEAVRVNGRDGQQLLELFQTDEGPVVRVLAGNTSVELPGKLRLAADTIEFEAGAGPIKIKASDDVIVNGEMIHLN